MTKRALDDRRLIVRYREHGDMSARDELIERLMPLARQLAMRYARRSEPLEDLVQVANMALVKAIDRFDPARGTALSTFAVPTILGELRRYFRDSTWSLHVGRQLQERMMLVERTSARLSARLGRSPSVRELAAEMQQSEEEIVEALGAAIASRTASLDEEVEQDDGGAVTLADMLSAEDDSFELVEDLATVDGALRKLDERSREILRLRFEEDLTQTDIAERLGISQMHVSRLLRKALTKLRDSATLEVAA